MHPPPPCGQTLAYRTKPLSGFSIFAEVEDVRVIGNDALYNDGGGNGITDRAVIADPEGTEINQAYLRYINGATVLTVGRQDLTHRGGPFHRSIGNVGWRQNRQTYDGVRLQNTSVEGLELEASYIYKVNRIFGEDNPLPNRSDFDLDGRLLRAVYKGAGAVTIEGYFYDLDFDKAVALSTTTIGLRLTGSRPIPGWNKHEKTLPKLVYAAEFARQSDTGDNPASYERQLPPSRDGCELQRLVTEGCSRTPGRPGESFKMPLATLHAFQGWADKFLATLDSGIVDNFFTLKGKIAGFSTSLVAHYYGAENSSFDYGNEYDLQITRKLGRYNLGLKYATYSADGDVFNVGGPGTDTDKLWVWVQFAYK